MRNLLIVCNPTRVEAVKATIKLSVDLRAAGFNLFTISDIEIDGVTKRTIADLPELEVALVLGGDGTMLRAAEVTRVHHIPLLGVNLGHVGFLAEVDKVSLETIVDSVVHKKYVIDPRMVCLLYTSPSPRDS